VFARDRAPIDSFQHDVLSDSAMNPSWTPLLWFGVIVVLIPLALWLLKRTPLGGTTGSGPLRHVAALQLSASQRLAIVEVGSGTARRWLVLGLSSQSITMLHTMEPQAEATPGAVEDGTSFAQLLSRLKRNP
jgi:flagellar protein FliO/FliZ